MGLSCAIRGSGLVTTGGGFGVTITSILGGLPSNGSFRERRCVGGCVVSGYGCSSTTTRARGVRNGRGSTCNTLISNGTIYRNCAETFRLLYGGTSVSYIVISNAISGAGRT